jgi:hypothetical protein
MEAGPDLDAKLAEAMGQKPREHEPGESYSDCACYFCGAHCEWGKEFDRPCIDHYSTDVSAAIAAAEEMRKAGRIAAWSVTVWPNWDKPKGQVYLTRGVNLEPWDADGDSPAHALTLALLAALKGA